MNITLSADEELIHKCREYARRHNTSLNALVRDFLRKLAGSDGSSGTGDELKRFFSEYAGESGPGYRFNREDAHNRGTPNREARG